MYRYWIIKKNMTEHSHQDSNAEAAKTVERPSRAVPERIPESVDGVRYLIPVPRKSGEKTAMYEHSRYFENGVEWVIMQGVSPELDENGQERIPAKHVTREGLERYKAHLKEERARSLAERSFNAVDGPQPTELVATPVEVAKEETTLKFRALQSLADKLGSGTFEPSIMHGQIAGEIDKLREELPGEEPTLAQAEALLKAMDDRNYSSIGRRISQIVSRRLER